MRRALVTGGSTGLGRALAIALAEDGWQVISVDRHPQPSGEAALPEGRHLTCDLSDSAAVDCLVEELAGHAPFHCAILNAGASATGRFESIPIEAQARLVRLNAETPMVLAAALAGRGMLKPPSHLVFIASLSHFTGYPGAAAYAASKDALAIYAKSIRRPFARLGIAVSVVFPGPLRTGHAERHAPSGASAAKRMAPDRAARAIVNGVLSGRRVIVPGRGPRFFALAGKLFPALSARAMRRLIYERLDRDVW